jgi:hypothetical protein
MSGGRITLAIYIAIGFIPVAFGPAAVGQSAAQYKIWPEALRQVEQSATVPPGWSTNAPAPVPLERAPEVIVINYGQGGILAEHKTRFGYYQHSGAKVEVRGPCYSACTLLLHYIEPEKLCIGERAFMAFHAVRSIEHGHYMENQTYLYFWSLPQPVKQWINAKGGWQKLELNSYMFLRDHELWAMGYPKCQ